MTAALELWTGICHTVGMNIPTVHDAGGTIRPTLLVVRAVGSDFLRRSLRPLLLILASVAVLLLALGGWLASRNAWWWLLEVPLITVVLVSMMVTVIFWKLLRRVDPVRSSGDRRAVRDFTDKLMRTTENLRTPYPVILFKVAADIVLRRSGDDSFIAAVAKDSKTLAPDFLALQRQLDGSRTFVESKQR